MDIQDKPLKWDDAAARHDPRSLPFWRFYEECQQAVKTPTLAARARLWLLGKDDAAPQ